MIYRRSSRVQFLRDRAAAALREARCKNHSTAERRTAMVLGRGYAQVAENQSYLEGEMLKQPVADQAGADRQEPH